VPSGQWELGGGKIQGSGDGMQKIKTSLTILAHHRITASGPIADPDDAPALRTGAQFT
jgi:hypothetical protein